MVILQYFMSVFMNTVTDTYILVGKAAAYPKKVLHIVEKLEHSAGIIFQNNIKGNICSAEITATYTCTCEQCQLDNSNDNSLLLI